MSWNAQAVSIGIFVCLLPEWTGRGLSVNHYYNVWSYK